MKQILGLTLTLVACLAWVTLAAPVQTVDAQGPPYVASAFVSGAARATITARSGQVLSVLEVPAGVVISVHLIKGEHTLPNDKTGDVTFSGDVSIRTRPSSELVSGPSLPQMMKAPLRLDVQDVRVEVVRDKK
jgi:hypothetical protein